jgi:leucyl-tRNA synthetase
VLGSDMEKMSKSRGNVMAPDLLVEKYGADIVRAYLMFFTRWNQGGPWDSNGIEGTARWMRRVWTAFTTDPGVNKKAEAEELKALRLKTHQTLEAATSDYQAFEFNTIVSGLMELMNEIYRLRKLGVYGTEEWKETVSIYLRILAPIAPHIAEELWKMNGGKYSIHSQSWPELDRSAIVVDEITLIVQVNGKLRDKIQAPANISDEDAKALALASETVQKFMEGKEPKKVIVIKGRLVNIVI